MILRKIICVVVTFAVSVKGKAHLKEPRDEKDCLKEVTKHAQPDHLTFAMQRGWWDCASSVIKQLAGAHGAELESIYHTEQRNISKQLNSLRSLLESNKPMQELTPAFEWAQSGEEVFINVKFAHKLDAPATLGVVVDAVDLSEGGLILRGSSPGRKQFVLDIQLHGEIDPKASSWALASVGRCTLQLKKRQPAPSRWPFLLAEGSKRPPNMHMWWAKHEQYASELEALEEAEDGGATNGAKKVDSKSSDSASSPSKDKEDL